MQHKWTEEDDAALLEMYASGMSCVRIGERLGLTKNAVIGRSHRLKLKRRGVVPLTAYQLRQREMRRAQRAATKAKREQEASAANKANAVVAVVAPPPPPQIEPQKVTRPKKTTERLPPSFPVERHIPAKKPPLPLVDLSHRMCHWPVNSPARGGEYLFCAAPMRTWPYCPEHTRIAFRGLHN